MNLPRLMNTPRLVLPFAISSVVAMAAVTIGLLWPSPTWAGPAASPAQVDHPQPLLELIAPGSKGRFYTLNDAEARNAEAGGFKLQPVLTGYMRAGAFPNSRPMHRLRLNDRPESRPSYLVTTSTAEREELTRPGGRFVDEGVVGYVAGDPQSGTMPLWRYRNAVEWRLVLDRDRAAVEAEGYKPDGLVGWVYPDEPPADCTPEACVPPVPGPPPGPPADTTAPTLRLDAAKRQRALRTGRIVVRARCSEDCSLSGRATARVKRSPQTREVRRSARAGQAVTLKLRVAPAVRTRVARALRSRSAVRAVVRITAMDAMGNRRTAQVRTLIVSAR